MRVATTTLVFCVAALLALGLVMLYSANMGSAKMGQAAQYLIAQLAWCGVGLTTCVACASIDYKHLKRIAWLLFGLAVVVLLLVLVPGIGKQVKGAQRWFDLKIMSVQPSEFAKLALIVTLAYYGERYRRQMGTFSRGVALPSALIGTVLVLVLAGRDYGTTLLLLCVSAGMLLVAGVRWKYFLPPILAAVICLGIAIALNPVRMNRVHAWLNPEETKAGTGYQAYQAMLALGSGGWTGVGLGDGRQKLGWVPEHHTDFILSVIGEELGVIATLAVVVAFFVLVVCGIYIAWNARDLFGLLLGAGISFLIGLQAFVNIGVVTSALPNKGLPLPFISYGGSNLVMMLACVGLLLNVARRAGDVVRVPTGSQSEEMPAPQFS
jgi:cell division protein FtsW